ncbi:glycoside hydrolase family 3 C-terminal domain-containing protein [Actinocrinis puniceicyclus]|uniref:Glycoside hydrolase family 3 C-terminal domain-containing protein n=1 Tax=Actinocrinis puniceicyclus TaxID=977794 RepID=A0A8J7WP95_9ACTN|nr:glycoside hydrolase family 3 C-terminal domain-containing protein [Actinocrinis puniceicyclus]MBS2963392.1 glycoside hydrolase family 3 C-terminal domain-containing protein [Actinocrinis puniceicyclus]
MRDAHDGGRLDGNAAGPPAPGRAIPAGHGGDRFEKRIARLSLPEKIRLLSGGSVFRTAAEPAAGLRAMVTSDGPIGVRGERWDERDTALALPSATAMAATWDEGLVERLGRILAAEARRKGVHVLLAPTLNLHRSPAGGRHFECFSEDPLLTGRVGAAYVSGVQSGGVSATAKHYVANDSETERLTLDARVDERTLREVYLAPFEAAVKAGVWAVMSAYNAVNGASMSHSALLAEPLKGEWGFDGLVVSDWGAVRSTVPSALAEQDLAMPGPNEHWGEPLLAAVRDGVVPESAIDAKLRRIFRLAERVGALDPLDAADTGGLGTDGLGTDGLGTDAADTGGAAAADNPGAPGPPAEDPDVRALLRDAVARSSVLLRNEENLLPLERASLRRVAVIGPNAATARIQGGGSASVFPATVVAPLDGIRAALADAAEVEYAAGAHITVRPTPLTPGNAVDPVTGEPGVRVRYLDADGTEVHTERRLSGRILEPCFEPGGRMDFASLGAEFVELSARLSPHVGGTWKVGVVGLGEVRLSADGMVLIDEVVVPESDDPTYVHVAPSFRQAELELRPGAAVELTARRRIHPAHGLAVALTADAPRRDDDAELAAALALAKRSDAAIVVVGTTDEIESEGFDRPALGLPGRQDELVAAVAAVNPRTVVLVNSGGPVLMPWLRDVPAVLLTWFPGQEAGDGIADVLFGAAEPGGRLPTTWAAAAAEVPVLDTTPVDGTLHYAEGLHIGYRAWLRSLRSERQGADVGGAAVPGADPMFWFGHGLGYTSWEYESVASPGTVEHGAPFTVEVTVRNTGSRPGREVVQVYLSRPDSALDRPVRWLAGFAAVAAQPGQSVTVPVEIAPRAAEHWSVAEGRWATEPGAFTVLAGSSAGDLPLTSTVIAS